MGFAQRLSSQARLTGHVRSGARRGSARVRGAGAAIVQTAAAAGVSWRLVLQLLPERRPVFEAATLTVQAGVSAALVVAVGTPASTVGTGRFLEALLGGAVSLAGSIALLLRLRDDTEQGMNG